MTGGKGRKKDLAASLSPSAGEEETQPVLLLFLGFWFGCSGFLGWLVFFSWLAPFFL
jgi:hypothetical protein